MKKPRLALVLSAGGARGAYEAGVLYYLRTGLPKKVRHRSFEINTGTSVGAINTVAIAAYAHDSQLQAETLKHFWLNIKQDDIYHRDFSATTHFLSSTIGGMMRNFLTFNPFHLARRGGPHFDSFLNTKPLKKFLQKAIPWNQIEKNVLEGPIDAVAINVTNLTTGRSELFMQKKQSLPYQGHYPFVDGPLKIEHVMASAAIPVIFPPEKIGKVYYADGGIRLFTPMSPAIQLGADRLIVVGLRKRPDVKDKVKFMDRRDKKVPTIAAQLGRLLNGMFLDRVEFDMEQLERINTIVQMSEKIYGKNYLNKLNECMKKEKLTNDIALRGLRKIQAIEIQPSEYINNIFLKWLDNSKKGNFNFSTLEKLLIRLLDIDPATGSDLLSYLTFAPTYIRDLFDMGYEDAKAQRRQLAEMMEE